MTLKLTVTSSSHQALTEANEFVFDKKSGSIGRSTSNTWVLPDELRHLSGKHAEINYENGDYFIVDTSTNGVYINGSDKALGKGNHFRLLDGTSILMGTFNIHVELTQQLEDVVAMNEPAKQPPSSSPFNSNDSDDLFADLYDDSIQTSSANKIEPLDDIQKAPPQRVASDDPFFDLDGFNADKHADKPPQASRKNPIESTPPAAILDDFFKPAPVTPQVTETPVNEPVAPQNSGGIPDDWHLSDSDDFFTSSPQAEKPEARIPAQDIPEPPRPSQTAANTSSLHSAFLDGLGMHKQHAQALTEQQLFLAGRLLRIALKGTLEVLQTRAEIKNEMRMDMTTIQPIENNPIKFAIDVEEAMTKLLFKREKNHMNAEDAMSEVYEDILSHQIAVISGIQASLSHVLKRFEPEALIQRFEEESPIGASIPLHRQAKLWEMFETLYDKIEREAEDDFNRLFGVEFAKAYDAQIKTLKNKRTT